MDSLDITETALTAVAITLRGLGLLATTILAASPTALSFYSIYLAFDLQMPLEAVAMVLLLCIFFLHLLRTLYGVAEEGKTWTRSMAYSTAQIMVGTGAVGGLAVGLLWGFIGTVVAFKYVAVQDWQEVELPPVGDFWH